MDPVSVQSERVCSHAFGKLEVVQLRSGNSEKLKTTRKI